MKKAITIIIGCIAFLLYGQPIWACDPNGDDDDIYIDGGELPEVDIYPSDDDNYDNNDDIYYGDWGNYNYPDYYDDDDDDNYNDGDGGNGTGGSGTSNVDVPSKYNRLSDADRQALNDKLREMIQNCVYNNMLNYLDDSGDEFSDIYLDPSSSVGGYNACTDVMTFQNSDAIDQAFPEEFIHFFQDHYYLGGICMYQDNNTKNNIEFEAKFTQDLINYINMMQGNNDGMMYYGEGEYYEREYWDWIECMTNEGTSMPSAEQMSEQSSIYNMFLQDWAEKAGVSFSSTFFYNIFDIFDGC